MLHRNESRRSKRKKKRKTLECNELDKKTQIFLLKNTRFDIEEIYEWYRYDDDAWKEYYKDKNVHSRVFQADCPDGKLYKSKVVKMYSMIIPEKNASVLVDHIFNVFDGDSNGSIDFAVIHSLKEFCKE